MSKWKIVHGHGAETDVLGVVTLDEQGHAIEAKAAEPKYEETMQDYVTSSKEEPDLNWQKWFEQLAPRAEDNVGMYAVPCDDEKEGDCSHGS